MLLFFVNVRYFYLLFLNKKVLHMNKFEVPSNIDLPLKMNLVNGG